MNKKTYSLYVNTNTMLTYVNFLSEFLKIGEKIAVKRKQVCRKYKVIYR